MTAFRYPRGGFFNGMGLTVIALVAILPIGLASRWGELLSVPASASTLRAFTLSAVLMALHKLECQLAREFDVAPVYLRLSQSEAARDPRQALFRMFVFVFLGMLALLGLALHGGPWPMLLLGVWIVQGLQELHHIGKSLAHRAVYAGTPSAVLFCGATLGLLLPAWCADLGLPPAVALGVLLASPAVIGALWWEHRGWIRATEALGLPVPYAGGAPSRGAPGFTRRPASPPRGAGRRGRAPGSSRPRSIRGGV